MNTRTLVYGALALGTFLTSSCLVATGLMARVSAQRADAVVTLVGSDDLAATQKAAEETSLRYAVSGDTLHRDLAREIHHEVGQLIRDQQTSVDNPRIAVVLDRAARANDDQLARANAMFDEIETQGAVSYDTFQAYEASVEAMGKELLQLAMPGSRSWNITP